MESPIADKLRALHALQIIDSQIDKIRAHRGELPMEVSDLEDDIAGLDTRLQKYKEELDETSKAIAANKQKIKDSQALIKKYESQLEKVKNNREYDALTKEIEIQGLEVQAAEKRIREYEALNVSKKEMIEQVSTELAGRKVDLKTKKSELKTIIEETEKEEGQLMEKRAKAEKVIDERSLAAYNRIRRNVKNGIAVSTVIRDACSGCFGNIPPQMQSDIRQLKKFIICEHCGRILVDAEIEAPEKAPAA